MLKQQLKESQAELVQKGSELVALRVALREARQRFGSVRAGARGLQEAARTRSWSWEACSQSCSGTVKRLSGCGRKLGSWTVEAAGFREPLCHLPLLTHSSWQRG